MKISYVCSRCGKEEAVTSRKPRCECGGLWKLSFTPPKFSLDLIDRDTWNLFRYRAFMPLLDESWREISLGEGMTPVMAFDEDLSLKMDYFMPTLSFKDRGAAVLVSHCKAIGVDSVVQDSSGNAGNSVPHTVQKPGLPVRFSCRRGLRRRKST